MLLCYLVAVDSHKHTVRGFLALHVRRARFTLKVPCGAHALNGAISDSAMYLNLHWESEFSLLSMCHFCCTTLNLGSTQLNASFSPESHETASVMFCLKPNL